MGVPITVLDKPVIQYMELKDLLVPMIDGKFIYKRYIVRWIWDDILDAMCGSGEVIVDGAYHDAVKRAEELGYELKIAEKSETATV